MKSSSTVLSVLVGVALILQLPYPAWAGAATEAPSAARTAVPEGPFGRYDPAITIRSARANTTLTRYAPGDDVHNNVWTREVADRLGIVVKYDWVVEPTVFHEKWNLTVASGDLPDYFRVPATLYRQLVETGQLADLTDAYALYSSPELRAANQAFPEGFASGMVDGKLMGMAPGHYGWLSQGSNIWIRSDWLRKYNLEPPKTIWDVERIALAFMQGESKPGAEVHGIALNRVLYGSVSHIVPLANAFHAYPGSWIRDPQGNIVYGSIQPEMREFLRVVADWYKKGIIHREFGVKDVNAANADLVSGRVGIMFGVQWAGWWPLNELAGKDPNAVFQPYAVPSSDDKPVRIQVNWPVYDYHVVRKDYPNPEAMIKMANLYVKYQFHGTEEEFRKFSDGGDYPVVREQAPIEVYDPRREEQTFAAVNSALRTGDASRLDVTSLAFYENARLWQQNRDVSGFGRFMQMGPGGSYETLLPAYNGDLWQLTELRGPDTPALIRNRSVLATLETDVFTKIIMGTVGIGAFDQFVRDWKAAGGDAVTAEINQTFKR